MIYSLLALIGQSICLTTVISLTFQWHRLGYDYGSGYEREMGGRPGYADERPHGRHMGRSSGGYQSGPSNGNCPNFSYLYIFFIIIKKMIKVGCDFVYTLCTWVVLCHFCAFLMKLFLPFKKNL